ncbi:TPA: hypothetical protein HA270_01665 [Candidatus Woesearchaeota archaeon]|nr:hypothetical protein [Candidatus Woesearchaeota archaeon]
MKRASFGSRMLQVAAGSFISIAVFYLYVILSFLDWIVAVLVIFGSLLFLFLEGLYYAGSRMDSIGAFFALLAVSLLVSSFGYLMLSAIGFFVWAPFIVLVFGIFVLVLALAM